MKLKVILLLNLVLDLTFGSNAQTAAVADLNVRGLDMSPQIAGKLTRNELIKTASYKVLDEFDMETILEGHEDFSKCYGKNCLIKMGEALDVDLILSGNIDRIGLKIIVSLKLIDVKNKTVLKSTSL